LNTPQWCDWLDLGGVCSKLAETRLAKLRRLGTAMVAVIAAAGVWFIFRPPGVDVTNNRRPKAWT
jgi:hypothetical protein